MMLVPYPCPTSVVLVSSNRMIKYRIVFQQCFNEHKRQVCRSLWIMIDFFRKIHAHEIFFKLKHMFEKHNKIIIFLEILDILQIHYQGRVGSVSGYARKIKEGYFEYPSFLWYSQTFQSHSANLDLSSGGFFKPHRRYAMTLQLFTHSFFYGNPEELPNQGMFFCIQ